MLTRRKSYYQKSVPTFLLLIVVPYIIGLLLSYNWNYEGNGIIYSLYAFLLVIIFIVMTLIFEIHEHHLRKKDELNQKNN